MTTESLKVLLTGGAGYLGRAILRRVAAGALPWSVTVFSRDEGHQDLCRARYPEARYVLGDVRDLERLTLAAAGHDVIIHAAALKFVAEAELNAAECIGVNVGGSENVIIAARRAGVGRVIGISSDKGVQPVSIYGATKMCMERLFAEASTPRTAFNCVRYGNVVGSTGSVIPLFRRQYAQLGKVLLTNPKMTRFWMGVDEAIDLILLALASPVRGTVFVPLVRAMRMEDVVLSAVGEVPVEIIGERPGEKMHERLLHLEESVRTARYPDHFEVYPPGHRVEGTTPFSLSSQSPHFWLQPAELQALIADAAEV